MFIRQNRISDIGSSGFASGLGKCVNLKSLTMTLM